MTRVNVEFTLQHQTRNKLMAEMRESGMTFSDIGAIFRISRQAVHLMLKRRAAKEIMESLGCQESE